MAGADKGVDDKRFVHELLDRILEFNLGVIENACSYDIDAMIFEDDWGMQTALSSPNEEASHEQLVREK